MARFRSSLYFQSEQLALWLTVREVSSVLVYWGKRQPQGTRDSTGNHRTSLSVRNRSVSPVRDLGAVGSCSLGPPSPGERSVPAVYELHLVGSAFPSSPRPRALLPGKSVLRKDGATQSPLGEFNHTTSLPRHLTVERTVRQRAGCFGWFCVQRRLC